VERQGISSITAVATCTKAAAHRRDHEHDPRAEACHPHVVEIVHLGLAAVCVCHDCRLDTGFVPRREAEALAAGHREVTRIADVKLRSA
jgi:hypothetical protein